MVRNYCKRKPIKWRIAFYWKKRPPWQILAHNSYFSRFLLDNKFTNKLVGNKYSAICKKERANILTFLVGAGNYAPL
jgi:hypothetical protein